ncbi:MAG: hypothetical protein Q4G33_01720 [bacterium]|nr:hypothetical protein [bacterium]
MDGVQTAAQLPQMKGDFIKMSHKSSSSSDKTINIIIAVLIIAFLAAGGYAVYSKVSDNLFDKAVSEGTAPQTVKTLARSAGQSVKEFLEENGITDGSVDGNTSTEDFYNHMTVDRYAAYNGQSLEELLEQTGLTGKVTETTSWADAQKLIPLGTYLGIDAAAEGAAEQFEMFKQMYGLDASVTLETPWGDVKDTVEAAQEAMANATEAPAEEATVAPADEAAADGSAAGEAASQQ